MMGNGECLFDNNRDNDEYNDDNKTTMRRMGRGCVREQIMVGNPTTTVVMLSVGRPLGAWGGGRLSAPTPLPPSSTMMIAATLGGRHAPPCPVHPVPPDAACHS
jgi:hypothetical protein